MVRLLIDLIDTLLALVVRSKIGHHQKGIVIQQVIN
jgi:hypothetical protein